ncbi:amidohydrolase [Streptomyces sp. IB2014 016-6]|uniref:amidohydrolase n=1 Tax=Streptomyces sp. IB2014 016-6 TaxID=2517818 RepID=UPI0011CA10AA|nr:amidohydrolase [Streptomyces sp. IB2014 016-6]TXL86828.1 amidohydrolase [Streptomyces sp. IB2014 016-6]
MTDAPNGDTLRASTPAPEPDSASVGPAAVPRETLRAALGLYLELHAHPELSGAETRTAARFAAQLEGDGATVTRGIGGHGVVGALRNGPGPTLLIRAELDALPIAERTGLAYASTVPGTMHACGHDLHLASAAGALALLAAETDTWNGTLLVVGQPAEETLEGADAMLADGLYERFGIPDTVLAQHTAPLPAGTLAHGRGPMMAASAALDVVIHGRGGHAGTPQLTVDPVVTAAATVMRLQTVVSRETAPSDQVVLTVGSLRAGSRGNVVPDEAELSITVRAATDQALERAVEAARRIVRAECAASGCAEDPDITLASRSPALLPDPAATATVRAAHEREFGRHRVLDWPGSMATEDFPRFAVDGVRTAYWMVGTTSPRQWREAHSAARPVPPNHSAEFAPDVRTALPAGIAAMATAVRQLFKETR